MSEYKGIKGFQVQTRTEDPVPYAQALADNPYAGTWGSGGALPQANRSMGVFGTYTSLVAAGGSVPTPSSTEADSYNGTAWSEITELSSAKNESMGFGSSGSSGYIVKDTTENWNGSAWTEVNDLNVARGLASAAGTSSASLLAGGESGPGAADLVEQWNGTSWTEIAEINTDRQSGSAMSGTVTAAIVSAGYTGTAETANAETWNGSSWTEGNNINEARRRLGFSGTSVPTALIFGGAPGSPGPTTVSGKTESYDGTSWTEVNDMATARRSVGIGVAGTGSNALAVGGLTPTVTTLTEEWAFSGLDPSTTPAADYSNAIIGDFYYNSTTGQFKTVNDGGAPIGTWGSSANLNTARGDGLGGFGTTSLAGVAGGDTGVPGDSWVANTEIYNGSSWSEVADLNTAGYFMQGTAGTSTSSITAGRRTSGNTDNVEQWNGSAWTEIAEINTARRGPQSAQPASAVSAFIIFGGYDGSTQVANTETWNGSSWTETTDMNTVKYAFGGGGAGPSDAIACGGQGPPGGNSTEIWDGSSWTEVAEMNASKIEGASAGISTLLMYGGGNNPGAAGLETCEVYNGSSWSEVNDLADGENGSSCHIGTATDCFFAGGIGPNNPNGASASTEHFTAADFQIKTVTTS
jgi:hypothetical protein